MKNLNKIFLFFVVLILTIPVVFANPQILTYRGGHWLNDRGEDKTAYLASNDIDFSTVQSDPWVIDVVSPQLTYYGSTTTTLTVHPSTFQVIMFPYGGYFSTGTWVWIPLETQKNQGIFGGSGVINDGDEYRYYLKIPSGNYTLLYSTIRNTNNGIHEVWINSTTTNERISSSDMYSSAIQYNVFVKKDFTLSGDVDGYLAFKSNGKNAASSNYAIYFSDMSITSRP